MIIGREFTLLGLRAAVASTGQHLDPSLLGKWKATVQFAALALAMIRPDVTIAGAFLDEWVLVIRRDRHGLVRRGLLRALLLRAARGFVSRVFVTGGSGVVGRSLVERLVARGDEVVALARSPEAEASSPPRRGDARERRVLRRGRAGPRDARLLHGVFHVAGVNALCVADPRPMLRANVEGPPLVVRAAARAGVPRLVHTSSSATIGEETGAIGREDSPHRGCTCLCTSARRQRASGPRWPLGARRAWRWCA